MNFDEGAKSWDTERRINRAKIIAAEIRKAAGTGEGRCAMEFGCGTGLISFNLYDEFKSITLVDSSKGMIDKLNEKIKTYNISNMTAEYSDLVNGGLVNHSFDVIYSSMALHHVKETEQIIKIFYRLLNIGGYLCIVDLDKDDGSFHKGEPGFDGHNGFDQKQLRNILARAGFKDAESKTFYFDEKIIEGQSVGYSLFLMKGRK